MDRRFDVAVVGATGLKGEAILSLLEQRDFPVGQLYLLDDGDAAGGRLEFKGSHLRVTDLAGFDFAKVSLAFFAGAPKLSSGYAEKAADAGCVVVDNSPVFRQEPDVPLVVAGVNSEAIAAFRERGIIASPCAVSIALALVLRPLEQVAGLDRVDVVSLQAVSGAGKGAVEELARQTAYLLNARPVEPALFPKQIAFNVLPQVGALAQGYAGEELKIIGEIRRLFPQSELAVSATAVRVPVFFGHSCTLAVETMHKITADGVRDLLSSTPGLEIRDDEGDYPTPVTEAANDETVWVGRIREGLFQAQRIDLWLTLDNVRRPALNSVQLAESLVKDFL